MPRDSRFALLLLCFAVSGFAALIYETVWTRQFSFVFGTSELAVATVLAAYMAGLAGGAALAGRVGPRVRRPILTYGLLELGIALAALAVPAAIAVSMGLYRAVFGGGLALADEGGLWRCLFYLACSFVILVVPTGLMGATLPLLTRHAVRADEQLGSRVGLLYTANTVGAVGGTVVAAFVLLPALGLRATVWVAIGGNLVVFLAAVLLARGAPAVEPAGAGQPPGNGDHDEDGRRRSLILPIMLVSGTASFVYEVLWARLLSQVLGGSVFGFATMLGTFLTGIALGAWIASRLATDRRRAARLFGWVQVGIAGCSALAYALLDAMAALASGLLGPGNNTLIPGVVVATITLLPSTVFIGATFPLAVRVLARNEKAATAASARVYAWNTTGAIIGAVGAGFILLPVLGFGGTLALALALNFVLALAAGAIVSVPRTRAIWAAAAGLMLVVLVRPGPPWELLRLSPLRLVQAEGDPVYFAVGRGATVLMLKEDIGWRLHTNGLPEGVTQPRGARMQQRLPYWLAALPCLARPDARRMMVVGLGAGAILEAVPGSIETIDTVEIEPEVVAANRSVAAGRRRDPLADPRVRIIVNDARGALVLSDQKYDVIVSQPSHPWTAAASHLYTREFFEVARDHLTPDGVLAQWMAFKFVDVALFRTLVATLKEVFAYVRVYRPESMGVILLASAEPLDIDATALRALAETPQDYARLGIFCPEDLAAMLVLDEVGARDFAGDAPISTDDRNHLAMRSPALIRRPRDAVEPELSAAFMDYDPLVRPTPDLDRPYMVRRLLGHGFPARAARVAEFTQESAVRALARAQVEIARDPQRASALIDEALGLDPTLRDAWAARLQTNHLFGIPNALTAQRVLESDVLEPSDLAVLEGWSLQTRGDWAGVRQLDSRLAEAAPRDTFFPDAVRLRAGWRLAEDDPDLAREAMAILDESLAIARRGGDMLLRARATQIAGEGPGLVSTLLEIAGGLPQMGARRQVAEHALGIIDDAAAAGVNDPGLDRLRAFFEEALEKG